jgi:hypothetical protein
VALPDVAHLDRVSQSAAGFDGEIGIDRVGRVAIENLKGLRARPEPAAVDFIFIGRPPIMERRRLNGLSILLHRQKHFPDAAEYKEQLLEVVRRIFRRYSQTAFCSFRNLNPNRNLNLFSFSAAVGTA